MAYQQDKTTTCKVSIIIPIYNRKHFIRDAIDSVLKEDLSNFEVILVDDGSTDGSVESVKDLPIRIVRLSENKGPAAARNAGIMESNGSYITFLDSDDILVPGSIKNRIDYLDCNPNELLVTGLVTEAIDENGQVIGDYLDIFELRSPESKIPNYITKEFFQEGNRFASPIGAPMYVMRRSLFQKIGYYDESLRNAYDWDFVFRILQNTSIPVINTPVFQYRVHQNNSSFIVKDSQLKARRRQSVEGLLVHWQNGLMKDLLS